MIKTLLARPVGSDLRLNRVAQFATLAAGCLVFVIGFRRMAELELTQAQLLLGVAVILSLFLQFGILFVVLDPERKRTAGAGK